MNRFEKLDQIIANELGTDFTHLIFSNKKMHVNRYKVLDEYWSKCDFICGLEIGRSVGYSAVAFLRGSP